MGSVRKSALPSLLVPRLQFQDYQFQVLLPTGNWKWTTRADVSKSIPVFEIRDIISPHGLLRDSIPIPGQVVEEMAKSITQIQDQFTPSILLAPTELTFTLDEGRGVSSPQEVLVTNDGVFGSLLAVAVTSSDPFVAPTPANVGGLAFNESGKFEVSADSYGLLAVDSPYDVELAVQDVNATNSPQVIPVTVNVRPRATIEADPDELEFNVVKPISGPFPPVPSQSFQLENTGPANSVLEFQIQKLTGASWLTSYTPVFGTLTGGSAQTILVAVSPEGLLPGAFTETLRISGYSTNLQVDVEVTLTVT